MKNRDKKQDEAARQTGPAARPATGEETVAADLPEDTAIQDQDSGQVRDSTAERSEADLAGEESGWPERLAEKDREIAALSDKYLRLMAEYDNFRRRSQKEKEAIYAESVVQVVREWLPVADNLDRAELAASQYQSEEARQIAEGIAMVRKQVEDIFGKLGIEAIPCCGVTFDPNLHDAVMHVEDESVGASVVVEELRRGYRRDDRVIRHSVVKVAN